MQFALLNGKIIQASPDAPKEAKCVYCGERVVLATDSSAPADWRQCRDKALVYIHLDTEAKVLCQMSRDNAQKDLDRILRIEE